MENRGSLKRVGRQYRELRGRLYELVDENPQAAIEAARGLQSDDIWDAMNVAGLKAGVLIDAGMGGRDRSAVDEGVTILKQLLEANPDRADIEYCLANGLTVMADLVGYSGSEWFLQTAELRRKARHLYQSSGSREYAAEITSQAFTNLGNALLRAYRFVEAYDYYLRALEVDRTNGIALTGAARVLLWFAQKGIGDRDILLGVAAQHLKTARESPERIRELAGAEAYKALSKLLQTEVSGSNPPDLSSASDYQRFVAKHRLALTPTIEGLALSMPRWDSLRVESITERKGVDHGVPPLFAMFNILKSEYLTARFLAYSALKSEVPESGNYSDTLDYARYGIHTSLLSLSQRSCIDLLDKVAVATSEYLGLPDPPRSITFLKRWFEDRKEEELRAWQHPIGEEIRYGNTALIALSEVSGDIEAGGFLEEKRAIRNSSTHRFVVLHDLPMGRSRESGHVDHFDMERFKGQLLETLQLTHAVLFYFVEMIKLREERLSSDGSIRLPLIVPDHAWVRGEADTCAKHRPPQTASS